MLKQLSRLILLGFLLSLASFAANAQGAARAVLYNTSTDTFPHISAYLNAYDGAGNFIHGLRPQEVSINEDGQSLPIDNITELNPGSQFVVAINLGPAYAIQDVEGFTRYEHVQTALQNWIEAYPPETGDNLSLITNDELEGLHIENPADWLSLFQSHQPNFDNAIPSLDVLSQAIIAASDPTARVGLGRGILLITPLPSQDSLAALPSLESLAKQAQVRVDVWMISSRAYFDSPGANQLANFATQTGGQFIPYSGEEPLPSIDPYVDQLRYTYSLTYTSKISSGDIHQISASVNANGLATTSEVTEISLSVQAPNPILISPPVTIVRNEQVSDAQPATESTYSPNSQQVEILTEFPDQYQRQLEKSSLIVDGVVVDENIDPPFGSFTWDLSEILEDGTHLIQVEVIDNLGLRGTTLEHQVKISIQEAPFNLRYTLKQNLVLILGIAAAVGLSLLIFVLIIQGKIQPKATGRLTKKKPDDVRQKNGLENTTPIKQATRQDIKASQERKSPWMNRFAWPKRQSQGIATEEAYLEFLVDKNGDEQSNRIPITQREITFGNDPTQATIDLTDPSLDALHTRILRDENGVFKIADEGSIAGTWVNYAPISSKAVQLHHGDTIHIGRICFKFKFTDTHKIPKLKVSHQESS